MLHHSVVGKLWITIIIFVSLIFIFLSIFLIEYFDHYYYEEQSNNLTKLGVNITSILEKYSEIDRAMVSVEEIVGASETNMIVADINENGEFVPIDSFFTSEELQVIYDENQAVVRLNDQSYKDFITFSSENDLLALAVPLYEGEKLEGAIILFHSFESLYKTTNDLKKIILLFATIGILLTTIFAFFLSTKITAPIRQIQKAANQVAKGNFQTKVRTSSSDEIGDLAKSFNLMADQLDETVKALSTEKDKLSNILKSMADSVITTDTTGKIIVTNPPAKSLFHLWKEGNIQLPDSLKVLLERVLKEQKNIQEDLKLNGKILSVVIAPLYSGQVIKGAVTLLRDVTYERKLNKIRKDFLANVSHELRTPISMLQGYSEAIIDDIAQTAEEKKELAQIIYDESLRMGRLVNELLDLARIESGNYELQYCNANVNDMINKVMRKFTSIAKELDIELINEVSDEINEISIDADRIEQVLTNLIDNAIRHTPKGGEINIRAKLKSNDKLLLEIQDTGVGIPEEDLPFVFERFYKVDKARTRGHSGTGLGLSIVKNIIQAHVGNILVTSKSGQGTTFSILLPNRNIED